MKILQQLVNGFLGWKLPTDFAPDCGISFKRKVGDHTYEPVGTNLLSASVS